MKLDITIVVSNDIVHNGDIDDEAGISKLFRNSVV